MVSICPHCVRTIGDRLEGVRRKCAIEHHSELLARYRDKLPLGNGGREHRVSRPVLPWAISRSLQ